MAEAQEGPYDYQMVLDAVDLLNDQDLDEILKELEKEQVLQPNELQDLIEKYPATNEKIKALLQLVKDHGYEAYNKFKKCLSASGQNTLVEKIEKAEKEEHMPVPKKKPRIEEQNLWTEDEKNLKADLIEYYLEYESTMPVAPLVEQHEAELTSFYVRPPMMAYKKPLASGQTKQDKTKISSYKELLLNGSDIYRNVYITADAGMGKTSFSKMLARTWCQAHKSVADVAKAHKPVADVANKFSEDDLDTMKKFDFLFLIYLREYQGKKTCSLDKMILNMLKSKLPRASRYTLELLEQVLCSNQCLIIVDGLDEWSHPEHDECQAPSQEIPHTNGWHDCSVLTTTRPWKLTRLSTKDIDRQVEITVLDKDKSEELETLAIEFLNETQASADSTKPRSRNDFEKEGSLKRLGDVPYIPFILLQLICLWFENTPIGESLCEVYSNVIELTIARWFKKPESGCTNCKCKSLKTHENTDFKCMRDNTHCRQYMPLFLKLGELAFSTLFSTQKMLLLFDKEMVIIYLDEDDLTFCLHTGLLSEIKDTMYFPHKTFQEFFCALFIASTWDNTDTGEISTKEIIANKCKSVPDILEMSRVFVFVCGLNPAVYSEISYHFANTVPIDRRHADYTIDVSISGYSLNFSATMEDYQKMQISCFLESARNQNTESKIVLDDIILTNKWQNNDSRLEEDELQATEKILTNNTGNMKSLSVFYKPKQLLSNIVQKCKLSECACLESLIINKTMPFLLRFLTDVPHKLKNLTLHNLQLNNDSINALARLTNLQDLHILDVEIPSDGLKHISDHIQSCKSLQQLILLLKLTRKDMHDKSTCTATNSDQSSTESSREYLLRSIEAKTGLTHLILVDSDDSESYVLDLSHLRKLQELVLDFPLEELHINPECLVKCTVNMDKFSEYAVLLLLTELSGAAVLKTLHLSLGIRNAPLRIPALPQLTEFTLESSDLRDSTVTLSPEITSLEAITLALTKLSIPFCRELFISISKLQQPITVKLLAIDMTAEEWRELLLDILGKLPKSIHVTISCIPVGKWREQWIDYILGKLPKSTQLEMEGVWRDIVNNMKASKAFEIDRVSIEKDCIHIEFTNTSA